MQNGYQEQLKEKFMMTLQTSGRDWFSDKLVGSRSMWMAVG